MFELGLLLILEELTVVVHPLAISLLIHAMNHSKAIQYDGILLNRLVPRVYYPLFVSIDPQLGLLHHQFLVVSVLFEFTSTHEQLFVLLKTQELDLPKT